MGKNLTLCTAIGVLLAPLTWPAVAEDGTKPQPNVERTPAAVPGEDQNKLAGTDALANASKHDKYAFVFFYRTEDARTAQLRTVFDRTVAKITERAESLIVRVNDPSEKEIVDRFKVRTAPMPFVFVVAPNGAVIHSYKLAFSEEQLTDSFASPGLEKTLKALQDGKMTFLCIQNGSTRFDAEAMKGVNAFKHDPRYFRTTAIVTIDPSDTAEAQFLKNIKVDPATTEAVTVLLAPPGKIVGTFKGATEKKVLLASVQNATKKKPCCAGKKGGCKKPAKKKG
jgi:hypothetical protein